MSPQAARIGIPIENGELAKMLFGAAQEVFTSMLGSDVHRLPDPPADQPSPFDGVLSLIGLAGTVIGNGTVVCTPEAARQMSSLLLMSEYPNVDDQVLDALGEIANMIIGGFKHRLEPHLGRLQMSIPSVIYGKNIATRNSRVPLALAVRCGFPGGEFEVRIRLAAARE